MGMGVWNMYFRLVKMEEQSELHWDLDAPPLVKLYREISDCDGGYHPRRSTFTCLYNLLICGSCDDQLPLGTSVAAFELPN
jgi:hypothetical protein